MIEEVTEYPELQDNEQTFINIMNVLDSLKNNPIDWDNNYPSINFIRKIFPILDNIKLLFRFLKYLIYTHIPNLKQRITELEQKYEDLNNRLNNTNSDVRMTISNLTNNISLSNNSISGLSSQLNNLDNKVDQLESRLNSFIDTRST